MYSEKTKLHARQKLYQPGNLRSIVFDVTYRCNMRCKQCYAGTLEHVKPISLEKLQKPLEELYSLGVYHYVLAGGEPVMDFPRLESIISMIHPDETYVNVLSNGWGIDSAMIKKLKALQVDKICFSLDSGIEEEHDKNRRVGSYKRVKQAVDNVLQEGLFVSVCVVGSHQMINSEGFKILYDYAKEKQIRLQVDIAMPVGRWEGRTDILITPEDSAYLKEISLGHSAISDNHRLVQRDIYGEQGDRCRAGIEGMCITVDGQLLPCNFLQFGLGNIAEKSIKEMRADLLKNPWFNGQQKLCLCGENREFIDQFILPYTGIEKPLDAYKIFNLTNTK